VCLTLLLLSVCLFCGFGLLSPTAFCFGLGFVHVVLLLFVILLAETNRSPFDFAEGESELVSGYNVEFRGSGFVLLFFERVLIYFIYIVFSCFCLCFWLIPSLTFWVSRFFVRFHLGSRHSSSFPV